MLSSLSGQFVDQLVDASSGYAGPEDGRRASTLSTRSCARWSLAAIEAARVAASVSWCCRQHSKGSGAKLPRSVSKASVLILVSCMSRDIVVSKQLAASSSLTLFQRVAGTAGTGDLERLEENRRISMLCWSSGRSGALGLLWQRAVVANLRWKTSWAHATVKQHKKD